MSTRADYTDVRDNVQRHIDSDVNLLKKACHRVFMMVDQGNTHDNAIETTVHHFLDTQLVKRCLKTRKDANAPKQARTNYLLYSNSVRDQVRKENPELSLGDLSKKIGDMWKNADKKTKAKFTKLAQKDKERVEKENENAVTSFSNIHYKLLRKQALDRLDLKGKLVKHGCQLALTAKASGMSDQDAVDHAISKCIDVNIVKDNFKPLKDENAPKQARTNYMFFSDSVRDEIRNKNPKLSLGEISKLIGERWKNVTDEVKAEFTKLALEDKERETAEKEAYQQKLAEQEVSLFGAGAANSS
jgi:hypothetical protein